LFAIRAVVFNILAAGSANALRYAVVQMDAAVVGALADRSGGFCLN
jgi:hypothetical protein